MTRQIRNGILFKITYKKATIIRKEQLDHIMHSTALIFFY